MDGQDRTRGGRSGFAPVRIAAVAAALALAACDGGSPAGSGDGGGGPELRRVVVTPEAPTLAAGESVQFQAVGRMSDGSDREVSVAWSATGGSITAAGRFTAGATAGSYRVVAAGPRGLADTARVSVTAGPPPPPPPPPGNYTPVIGADWRSFAGKDELKAADLFWWFRTGDVYQYVDLVPDATFGQVARITFQQSSETGYAPKIDASLPRPLDDFWFRWRMRYSPGWTTVGPNPAGYANSYKVAFWLWDGYEGRGQVEISNTDEYVLGFGVNQNGTYLNYTETTLPGSRSFGRVTTEWSDGEWWEFVVHYHKTGATTARQQWWRRRLTRGGATSPGAWTYIGVDASGAPTPRVRGITLGANKNKSNPSTMYIYWGPWEVVDGSRYPNPFGMAEGG